MTSQSVTAKPVTRLFTHGFGQTCQFTGEDLGDRYTLVTAPDASSARLLMVATFGRNWAFEYDGPTDPRIADYMGRMTLHAELNIAPRQPMPPGFEYAREAAPEDGALTTPKPVIHVSLGRSMSTECGRALGDLSGNDSYVTSWSEPSTCKACADEVPF